MAKVTKGKTGIKEVEFGGLKVKFINPFKPREKGGGNFDLSEGYKAYLGEKEAKKNIDSQREDEKLHRIQSGRVRKRIADPKSEIKNKFKKLMRDLDNFNDLLEELKENGVIVDKNAQSWVKGEIKGFKGIKEGIDRIEEGDIEKWNKGIEKDLAVTHEKIVEFEKRILEKNIRDFAPNLDKELDKYEEYIDNLEKNYIYGRDHIKDYEFNENIVEMRSFIAEISAAIGDDFGKAVKVLNKSENTEDLENAILDIAGAIGNLREGIEENKMNFSPEFNKKQKANYFTNKEEDRINYGNNNHRSAAG